MSTSYKHKIYTTLGTTEKVESDAVAIVTNSSGVPTKNYSILGRSIVWNQLFTNSVTPSYGVTISQASDGMMTLNGTSERIHINFSSLSDAMNQAHKYLLYLRVLNNPDKISIRYGWLNRPGASTKSITSGEICSIYNQTSETMSMEKSNGLAGFPSNTVFNDVKLCVMVFDLTQMFGAGNEPTTPAQFRAMFPDDYYPYNAGELKSIEPTSVEAKNQSGEIKRVNIPSSKYFPDGMKSAGSARDEIQNDRASKYVGSVDLGTLNWTYSASGKYFATSDISDIKKISGMSEIPGLLNVIYPAFPQSTWYLNTPCMFKIAGDTLAFCIGDPNYTDAATFKAAMSGVMLYYELDTPVSTAISPALQSLPTYKGFTSFSAPNSLTQNGPLSVTYYAEGGENPESGWLTSYKRKLYMGRSIEWNQLIDKSKPYFTGNYVNGGVTWINNGDGTYSATGSPTASTTAIVQKFTVDMPAGHVYYLGGTPSSLSVTQDVIMGVYKNGTGVFTAYNQIKTAGAAFNEVRIVVIGGRSVDNVLVKPQLFDLTQMFGEGNEPATPAEFWSYFDNTFYPYDAGTTKPLFKISRKSYWGGASSVGT